MALSTYCVAVKVLVAALRALFRKCHVVVKTLVTALGALFRKCGVLLKASQVALKRPTSFCLRP